VEHLLIILHRQIAKKLVVDEHLCALIKNERERARTARMANLVESPDGVSRAAIGDPLTTDKLAGPALQDAQLMFQAARREARIGPNLRHGFRR